MGKLIIVSNRLPVTVSRARKESALQFHRSVGGLSSGLSSFYKSYNSIWVGWPGIASNKLRESERSVVSENLNRESCYPVFLGQKELENYYYGFSNNVLWPLFHYFPSYVVSKKSYWKGYVEVNGLFADTVAELANPGDTVWVHDYQLMLLPSMLRSRMPQLSIGFFLHIPFPSFEIFRILPFREEILKGVMGANLIGFHTYDYVRHFLESVRRILGFDSEMGYIYSHRSMSHITKVDMFPIGIDVDRFTVSESEVEEEERSVLERIKSEYIVLSVDRLDYTKGILNKVEAFDRFLDENPEYVGKVSLILLVVPSRTTVESYRDLKKRIDETVGAINSKRSTFNWFPIYYLYRALPFKKLLALYRISDIALVTPLRDGMNLVAKEFLAAKQDKRGVLILSEMAGAADELGEAIIVNPNDTGEITAALKKAIKMPEHEKIARNTLMLNRIRRYNIIRWARDFINSLDEIKKEEERLFVKLVTPAIKKRMLEDYNKSEKRLFLLDYDGTLVDFEDKPEKAIPDGELYEILNGLSSPENNEVVIVSGRNRHVLEEWFGHLPVNLVAEHGVWIRHANREWKMIERLDTGWKPVIRPILEVFVDRTPGSFVEEKEFSLVWHYRKVDSRFAELRAMELKDALLEYASSLKLEIMDGNHVLEIKNVGVDKGKAVIEWVNRYKDDFIFAAGDDFTDESIFNVLPDSAYSIKVGLGYSRALYSVLSVREIRDILNMFRLQEVQGG